jgi:hypothetical protein
MELLDGWNEFEGKTPKQLAEAARGLADDHYHTDAVRELLIRMADVLDEPPVTESQVRQMLSESYDRILSEARSYIGGSEITGERVARGIRVERDRLQEKEVASND